MESLNKRLLPLPLKSHTSSLPLVPGCLSLTLHDICRFVYVWDTTSRRILYKLPGHAGSINEVAFHPDEPISKSVLTGSLLASGL